MYLLRISLDGKQIAEKAFSQEGLKNFSLSEMLKGKVDFVPGMSSDVEEAWYTYLQKYHSDIIQVTDKHLVLRGRGNKFYQVKYKTTEDGYKFTEPVPVNLVVEQKTVASYHNWGFTPVQDEWDAAKVVSALKEWAGGPEKENIDWDKYRQGFLWYDSGNPESFGSYKLPYAQPVDGVLKVVPNALNAVASRLPNTDIPEEDKAKIKKLLDKYRQRLNSGKNALKTFEVTDDKLIVGNYLALFGGADLAGEWFTPNTQFESSATKNVGRLPVDWEHGSQKTEVEPGTDEVLGYVDWSTARKDDKGLFVRRVLNRRNRYVQMLEDLIAEGLIGTSSQAKAVEVKKSESGEILVWPLIADTLTVTTMEPKMLCQNTLQTIKSLADEVPEFKKSCEAAGLLSDDDLALEIELELLQIGV